MADYAIHEETLTDIADVIRKKDGTSALIDPADYADRINLMGMLEEKTVSGTIAHFDDGADSVPLKSLVANLPASLTAYEEVKITHAGKNLLNDSIRGHAGANIYFGHDTGLQNEFSVRLRAGTYTFSVVTADGTVSNLYIKNSDTDTNLSGFPAYATLSKTFTLSEDTNCAVFVYKSGYTDVTDILTAQIEAGSPSSDYEAYQAPTTYEIDIPNPNPNLRLTADVDDGQWNTDGTIHTPSGGSWYRAFTMAVSEKMTYDIYGLLDDLIVYLDSNKTMISYERLSNTALSLQDERKTTPANCAYIGLTALVFDVSSVSVKESFLVYGGSIEVISGQGTSKFAKVDMGDLNWVYDSTYTRFYTVSLVSVIEKGPSGWKTELICDIYTTTNGVNPQTADKSISEYASTGYVYVKDLDYTDATDFKSHVTGHYIVYPIASPESFNVEPISVDSKANSNNIWNDAGDSEVVYRSQGTAYIYPEGEGVSF